MAPSEIPSSLFRDESHPGAGSAGWVIAHCDGGARGNPGPAGYGAVLHDQDGQVLAELSEFLGVRTNNYAEYAGLLACLQWVLDQNRRSLQVISDSLLMVRQVQGQYKVNSPDLRPLWEEARRRIAKLDRFEITHALRHKNKAADRLANQAMDRGTARPADPQDRAGSSQNVHRAAPSEHIAASPPSGRLGSTPETARPNHSDKGADSGDRQRGGMLRGFTRDGAIHLLGGVSLPDGVFVKVIPE